MNNYTFINSEYIYLAIIPLLIFVWYFFKNKENFGTIVYSDIDLVNYKNIKTKTNTPSILKIIASLLLVIALARPQSSINWEESSIEGIDIVLSIDISGSMLAQDLKPNRLEHLKMSQFNL